jgi:cell division transport system permease protein
VTRLFYFLRRSLTHIGRSPVVAGVTVGTVAVVFLIMGVFALVGHNLELLTHQVGSGLKLSVFLLDGCDEPQREAVQKLLTSSEGVERVLFVDRQEAASRFRQRFGRQAEVLDELDENPLPESFEVTFSPAGQNPRSIGELAQRVVNLPGVEEVQYGQAWLDRFFRFVKTVRLLGLGVGVLIFLAALLIVSNTIRLSVYARREEIHILKLVGATDGFIKVPFYLEGVLLGLLGAGLGIALTWSAFALLVPEILVPGWLQETRFTVAFLPFEMVIWMVGAGAFLGVLGTMSSLWRYLKI